MSKPPVLEAAPGLVLRVTATDSGVRAVAFGPGPAPDPHPLAAEALAQLRAYFAGKLWTFNLPLDLRGTPFQLRVWNALLEIPYGETRSYGQIARCLDAAAAVRAVGAANGANPVAIVVPCHRVIGSGGQLTGYGGGLHVKRMLLELEAKYAWRSRQETAG